MPKLEPSPSRLVTQEQTNDRSHTSALPHAPSLAIEGPSTDRIETRRALLDLVKARSQHQEPLTHSPQPERSAVPSTSTTTPAPLAQPEAHQRSETLTQPEATKPGFFASIKETFLKLTGLHQATHEAQQQPESASKGSLPTIKDHFSKLFTIRTLGEFGNWARSLVSFALSSPRLERIAKPVILRDSEETKRVEPEPARTSNEWRQMTEPAPRLFEKERHFWEAEAKPIDLTVQALITVADAKREENAKEEKNKLAHSESDRRTKDAARENLKKLPVEGVRKAEMAAILNELEGVYGTAEVAQRQILDLIAHRKNFQS